jgi:CBS domain-containing protein
MSVFPLDVDVSTVLGELSGTGYYEGIVVSDKTIGLVTIRDFLIVTQPTQTSIANFVTVTGTLSPDTRIGELAAKLINENIRAVPLMENGDVIGGISQIDLLEALSEVSEYTKIHAETVMNTLVYSLDSSDSVASVRKLMLDHNISHIPITENQELVGMVCAKDIVQMFIIPIGTMTVGERAGESIPRFEGAARSIMDPSPLTVSGQTTTNTIIRDLIDQGKSACVVVDASNRIQGIITPRELLTPLLLPLDRETIPIYIVGLSDEDGFDRSIVETRIRRVVERGLKLHPHIHEVAVRVETTRAQGNRTLYELTVNIYSSVPDEQFAVTVEEWGLLEAFAKLATTLDTVLRRSKHSL